MGIKERKIKILLALFFLTDTQFKHIVIDSKFERIFDITLNQKTKSTIRQLTRQQLIEEKDDGENIHMSKKYALTLKGVEYLSLHFPFCRFLFTDWDKKLRIISYEIPESKREIRDRFRREIAGWGFGPWHRSFWLTPHPIIPHLRELVFQREEEKYIQAFESDHVVGEKEILIEKVWRKSILENKYRELFRNWHQILSGQTLKEEKYRGVIRSYVIVLKEDPGLPKDLIGNNWIGFEAFSIYKEIRSILLS